MAQATVIGFSKFKVELGDGAAPEVFTAPCGFNARALNQSKNLSEIDIPDCDDEDAATWVGREVRSKTWNVSGEGVLPEESIEEWEAFWESSTSRSVKVTLEYPTTQVVKTGKGHLETYNQTANRGEKVGKNIVIQGDGALTVVITP